MLEFIILFSFILILIAINLLLRNTNDKSRRYNRRLRGPYAIVIIGAIGALVSCGGSESDNRRDSETVAESEDSVRLSLENEDYEVYITQEDIDELKEELPDSMGHIMTDSEFKGMRLFMLHCNKCHPGGEKGVGPSLNDKPLPDFLIHFQIRQGMGDMPAFTREELSKEEVQHIVRYVRFMRKNFGNES
jgi:hypothetical protein